MSSKKCYRLGCTNEATEKYQNKKSVCWLDPVCTEHQFVEPKEKINTVTEFFEKGGKMCDCDHEHDGECPEEVCEICGGKNGNHEDISTMERVWANEPHMADIGSEPCPNSLRDPDDYDDQE